MKNNLFIDSDIIIDVYSKRDPFYESSAKIISLGDCGKLSLSTSPVVIANVFYILKKYGNKEFARSSLMKIRKIISVLSVNEKEIDLALASGFSDFEDAIQYYVSIENKIDFIITRNKSDYKKSKIPVCNAQEYINLYKSSKGFWQKFKMR